MIIVLSIFDLIVNIYCFRDPPGASSDEGATEKRGDDVCPWDTAGTPVLTDRRKLVPGTSLNTTDDTTSPWDSLGHPSSRKNSTQFDSGSSSSEISLAVVTEVSEKLKKSCGLQDRFGRRSSSCAVKTPDTRPSVSSTEDFPAATSTPHLSFDSTSCTDKEKESVQEEPANRLRKKSTSGPPGRKQSTTIAPVISVSSVSENAVCCVEEGEEDKEEKEGKEDKPPEDWSEGEDKTTKSNEICPWEDE